MQWLQNELIDAEKNGKSVYIIGHIPPYDWLELNFYKYSALSERFKDTIKLHMFAHLHQGLFKPLYNWTDRTTPFALVYSNPSLTTFDSMSINYTKLKSDNNNNISYYGLNNFDLSTLQWNEIDTQTLTKHNILDIKDAMCMIDNIHNDQN